MARVDLNGSTSYVATPGQNAHCGAGHFGVQITNSERPVLSTPQAALNQTVRLRSSLNIHFQATMTTSSTAARQPSFETAVMAVVFAQKLKVAVAQSRGQTTAPIGNAKIMR